MKMNLGYASFLKTEIQSEIYGKGIYV